VACGTYIKIEKGMRRKLSIERGEIESRRRYYRLESWQWWEIKRKSKEIDGESTSSMVDKNGDLENTKKD
jgi:hypothetical protein